MVRTSLSSALALLLFLLPSSACEAPSAQQEEPAEIDDDDDDEQSDDHPGLSGFGENPFAGIASMLKSRLDEPGPYDEPKRSEGFDDSVAHWDVVELSSAIVELPSVSLLGGSSGTELRVITDYFDTIAASETTTGVILRLDGFRTNMALADEVRQRMLAVREAGKQLHCHAEGYSNVSYYVATACDQIAVTPLGGVQIPGPAAEPMHVKGLLDNLGVQADFLHVGAFKGAAEPLTLDEPSPQMRETLGAILDDSYRTMVGAIVEGRGLSSEQAKAAIDVGFAMDEDAVAAKLVDRVAIFEELRAESVGEQGWHRVKLRSRGGPDFDDPLALQRFLGILPPQTPSEPHVALVYALGNIVDGKGGGVMGARETIASRPLSSALRRLAADDSVAAVVMRVDSPGGSALASDLIHQATLELVAKKPLIVSMGSVAASGGYYISAGATHIFADANTLTGSIGVVGGKIAIGGAMEKVGVRSFGMKKGERGLMWSSSNPWSADEREAMQSMMEDTYEAFLARVVAGRDLPRDAVHAVAQGRVWTGDDAQTRGLVDDVGSLENALSKARELSGVGEDVALQVYPPAPTLRDFLGSLDAGSPLGVEATLRTVATVAPEHAERAARMVRTLWSLRDTRVWAVEWLRPAR
jgi:protease-4